MVRVPLSMRKPELKKKKQITCDWRIGTRPDFRYLHFRILAKRMVSSIPENGSAFCRNI